MLQNGTERIKIICGNWKMNKVQKATVVDFCDHFSLPKRYHSPSRLVAIAAPTIYLDWMTQHAQHFLVAAQNCCFTDHGAYTGGTSVLMLQNLKVSLCLVGHSERRSLFRETNALINKKVRLLLKQHLTPVLCIGESVTTLQNGHTLTFLRRQLTAALEGVTSAQAQRLVIAYEPVWAIGTGKVAAPAQIQSLIVKLRAYLARRFNLVTAQHIPIIYGGSVKVNNAAAFLKQPDIDGLLVGGASLDPARFRRIIDCFFDEQS